MVGIARIGPWSDFDPAARNNFAVHAICDDGHAQRRRSAGCGLTAGNLDLGAAEGGADTGPPIGKPLFEGNFCGPFGLKSVAVAKGGACATRRDGAPGIGLFGNIIVMEV